MGLSELEVSSDEIILFFISGVSVAILSLGLLSPHANASCETKHGGSDGQYSSWVTSCDSRWSELGKNMGWAKGCNYGGSVWTRFRNIHSKIKAARDDGSIEPKHAKEYFVAFKKMLHYDRYGSCSKENVSKVLEIAETMFSKESQGLSSAPKQPSGKNSGAATDLGQQRVLENDTALIAIDSKEGLITVANDGDGYQKVWEAVKARKAIDVGVLVSDKYLNPKRFEFPWQESRQMFASKVDGVAVILIDDPQILRTISDAYSRDSEYVYIAAKLNDTNDFKWWRLKRSTR